MGILHKLLVPIILLFCLYSVPADAIYLYLNPGVVNWHLEENMVDDTTQCQANFTFMFKNITGYNNVSVYIEECDSDLFSLHTIEIISNDTIIIYAYLFINLTKDSYYKGKSWNFLISGDVTYDGYIHKISSKINVYTHKPLNMSFLYSGVGFLIFFTGLGVVLKRRQEKHEKN